MAAGTVFVGGALGTEFPISYWYDHYGYDFIYGSMNVVQETMEILGASMFLSYLLRYIEMEIGPVNLSVNK
jgi:hypothetical protein